MFHSFPDDIQWHYINEWIVPGAVVRIDASSFVDKTNPMKYVVVLSPDLVFMVNTEARYSPHVSTQVELKEADYPGMIETDCWINCNAALDDVTITMAEIKRQVKNDRNCYKGKLNAEEVKSIIHAMTRASGISPIQRKAIVAALLPLAA
jgi:hypothetical protein